MSQPLLAQSFREQNFSASRFPALDIIIIQIRKVFCSPIVAVTFNQLSSRLFSSLLGR